GIDEQVEIDRLGAIALGTNPEILLLDVAQPPLGLAVGGEDVLDPFAGERLTPGTAQSRLAIDHAKELSNAGLALQLLALVVVRQQVGEGLRQLGEGLLGFEDDTLGTGRHAGAAQLGVKGGPALLAGQFEVLHAELLLGDHRSPEDWSAMAAAVLV